MTVPAIDADPRKRRSREALVSAFFGLVLTQRYHEIRIADILQRAGVSRSTFYEHFGSKHALLSASLEGPFSILAGVLTDEGSPQRVALLLEHFWQNRALARSIFQGAANRIVRSTLVSCIEEQLRRDARLKLRIPRHLAAHALADGMFSPIVAWLSGAAPCRADDLAASLHASARAMLSAL